MSERHSDNDGSDIFWPGYVDAVTNLVLNLLFLLTIMIIAVFMFALELGRASMGGAGKKPVDTYQSDSSKASKPITKDTEIIELKLEIQRLNKQLSSKGIPPLQQIRPQTTIDVAPKTQKAAAGLDRTVANDPEVLVRFKDEAVSFSAEEQTRLLESLKTVQKSSKVSILVEVPAGFSEAKRMGFYRAMAVRNLLIEMKVPKERIDVSVVEGKSSANASLVRVIGH
ncbi:MAG: hypothetical protein HXX17_01415 [Geobacteraceae bacterium]|nr:hypothetical protein [Geobacteraceae bacterium]